MSWVGTGRRILLGALLAVFSAGCSGGVPGGGETARCRNPPDPDMVDGQRAWEEMRELVALGARDAGTEGAARAAAHLADRLAAMGIDARTDVFEDRTPVGVRTFRNVVGVVRGHGDGVIVLGSHYDTKAGMPPEFQGANDSGSSTGLLLELGRVLAGTWRGPQAIWLAFLDGEECLHRYGSSDGLHGSRRLAGQLRENPPAGGVSAVVILDMVGDCDLTLTLPRNGTPALASAFLRAAREEGVRHKVRWGQSAILDDHVPFLEAGMPAIDVIDFEFGSQPGRNDYWHTAEDRMDKVCAESLEMVGRLTLRLLGDRAVCPGEGGPVAN